MSAWLLATGCLSVVVVSWLGGVLPLATVLTHTRLQVYLSFAAGSMLGAAFFHMLPEAVEAAGSTSVLRWAAGGLLTLFFLERFFAFHHHESPSDLDEPCPPHPHEHARGTGHAAGLIHDDAPGGGVHGAKHTSIQWRLAAFGLGVHTIAGGVALASASTHPGTALGVLLATLIHKPADSLTIVSLMLRAGVKRSFVHIVNLGFSLLVPAGVGLFFLSRHWAGPDSSSRFTADALAFSAGTFLCIALSDLLPELQFHAHDRLKLSASLLAGFGLMALAAGWG